MDENETGQSADTSVRLSEISAQCAPFVVASLILVAFLQPIIPFAEPAHALGIGFSMALSVWMVLAVALYGRRRRSRIDWPVSIGVMVAPIGACLIALPATIENVHKHRDMCRHLQVDMLKKQPSRNDARELFSALNCPFQSVGTLHL